MKPTEFEPECDRCGGRTEYREGPNNIGFVVFGCDPCRSLLTVHKTRLTELPALGGNGSD